MNNRHLYWLAGTLTAIGAGIDIATGKTLTVVWKNAIVTVRPDTGNAVSDIEVPHWDQLLELVSVFHAFSILWQRTILTIFVYG